LSGCSDFITSEVTAVSFVRISFGAVCPPNLVWVPVLLEIIVGVASETVVISFVGNSPAKASVIPAPIIPILVWTSFPNCSKFSWVSFIDWSTPFLASTPASKIFCWTSSENCPISIPACSTDFATPPATSRTTRTTRFS